MGAGRKTSTYSYDTAAGYPGKVLPKYRELAPEELGGVIFGTTKDTFNECVTNKLFGLPRNHFRYVRNIRDGMPVFLFNYSERKLYGVYVADGEGDLDICPTAWATGGKDSSPYPAQVRVKLRQDCKPLTETAFYEAVKDNYYTNTHFMFELDQAQAASLLKLFTGRSTLHQARPSGAAANPYGPSVRSSTVGKPLVNAWTQQPDPWAQASSSGAGAVPGAPPVPTWEANTLEAPVPSKSPPLGHAPASNPLGSQASEQATRGPHIPASSAKPGTAQYSLGDGSSTGGKMSGKAKSMPEEEEAEKTQRLVAQMKEIAMEEAERTKQERETLEKLRVMSAVKAAATQFQPALAQPGWTTASVPNGSQERSTSQPLSHSPLQPPANVPEASSATASQAYPSGPSQSTGERPVSPFSVPEPGTSLGRAVPGISASASSGPGAAPSSAVPTGGGHTGAPVDAIGQAQAAPMARAKEWEVQERERALQEQKMLQVDRSQLVERLKEVDALVAQSVQKNVELCAAAIFQMRQDSIDLRKVMDFARAKTAELAEVERLRAENLMLQNKQVAMEYQMQGLQQELAVMRHQFDQYFQGAGAVPSGHVWPDEQGGRVEGDYAYSNGQGASAEEEVAYEEMPQAEPSEIYLMGGYNSSSWLGTVEAFSPSANSWRTVAPMLGTRSYAAAAVLDGRIFIFGGGDGSSWYDSVECYDKEYNSWVQCAPLHIKRGSLGGVSCQGHLYALGGGNGEVMFNEVERYDPTTGVWYQQPSMLNKRFCVATVELNGAVYAAGGFDGNEYLTSVERFDPREGFWSHFEPMRTKRGSLSAAVLQGKLYTIGGFDGAKFLDSVEMYDPRADKWQMVPSMSCQRAYGAAAVVGDTLYCIGGLGGKDHVDKIESYRDSSGWEDVVHGSDVSRKRSFLAVAAL